LANGFPLAAVVGRAAVMEAATTTWISSTAAAEATGLAAAQAVLEWHEQVDVPTCMAEAGQKLQAVIRDAVQAHPALAVQVAGPPIMWRLEADRPELLDAAVAAAARAGVLLKRGAYHFAALAHDDYAVDAIAQALQAWPDMYVAPDLLPEDA
jgi:glutamate-1-semialdehyde 2,1-aminomutase